MNIYDYIDFRQFLREYCDKLILETPKLSYRSLAKKAGFSSPGYFQMIIDGRRNLSEKSIDNVCKTLGLNTVESKYFANLVHFNQSKSNDEKDKLFRLISRARSNAKTRFLQKENLNYFSDQNIVTIREMVALPDFKEDFDWIHKRLTNKISNEEIQNIINFLLDNGFLKRKDNGKLVHGSGSPITAPEVNSDNVFKYQCDLLTTAQNSLKSTPFHLRDFTTLTIPIPNDAIPQIKDEIKKFRETIIALINHGSRDFGEIYQLCIQLFPQTAKYEQDDDTKI